ncbi:unnamed protein product [Caenorhabditis auriculariae]|uniref:Ubiquitinyl hydrolase 1 n=1 Tax=Caenorhabditis auriculariae TaxID=2777116 RepID=A0A8S1HC84_9PELO|nr:unnamed protein product [Caenorhabditis auriculariae]
MKHFLQAKLYQRALLLSKELSNLKELGNSPDKGDALGPDPLDIPGEGVQEKSEDIDLESEFLEDSTRKRCSSLALPFEPLKRVRMDSGDWKLHQIEPSSSCMNISREYQQNVDTLTGMGFNEAECHEALRMSSNDLEKSLSFLTREVSGLDSVMSSTSSRRHQGFALSRYVESDEEELDEDNYTWRLEDEIRVKCVIDTYDRYIFYRKHGSFARCLEACYKILSRGEKDVDLCLNFIDEVMNSAMTRHVNPPEGVFIGPLEIGLIKELYRATIPVLALRLRFSPMNIKVVLCLEEILNQHNRFLTSCRAMDDELSKIGQSTVTQVEKPLWCDSTFVEIPEPNLFFVEIVDDFIQNVIPSIDLKLENPSANVVDIIYLLRTFAITSAFVDKENNELLKKVDSWISFSLEILLSLNEKSIRDSSLRHTVLEVFCELTKLGELFKIDVNDAIASSRMEFLKKCIKCSQMECALFAMEELGSLADSFSKPFVRARFVVPEAKLKGWLQENNVLQIVLTGNMDNIIYVDKIRPILHYMTSELTADDLKFVWSLRKGRLGVSVDNFNKIMELIAKGLNIQQIEWMSELFQKSFRNKEVRLFESIFAYCHLMAQSTKSEEIKQKLSEVLMQLLTIAHCPPQVTPFKSLEMGIKKHIDIINMLGDKSGRDRVLKQFVDKIKSEDFNIFDLIYLYNLLDKIKRMFTSTRRCVSYDNVALLESIRSLLRNFEIFEKLVDRLIAFRERTHQSFQDALGTLNVGNYNYQFSVIDFQADGSATYGFVLDNYLRLLRWIVDNDIATLSVERISRMWEVLVLSDNSTPKEKSKLFRWLSDFKPKFLPKSSAREVLNLFCSLSPFTLEIDGLRCFTLYLDTLPVLTNEDIVVEDATAILMKNCYLFFWKLALFNEFDQVVDKVMITFSDREIVNVDSPILLKENILRVLSVFIMYMEKLKREIFQRNGLEERVIGHSSEHVLSEEERKLYDVPLGEMSDEAVARSIDRLLRLLVRLISVGNEKNQMVRQKPSHGSSISGHEVVFNIELQVDDEAEEPVRWRSLYANSHSTVGELRVRIASRLFFFENSFEFLVYRRDNEITSEIQLKHDWMTLNQVKLASRCESIFQIEKVILNIVTKQNAFMVKKPVCDRKPFHENYLPAALFYDLIHELCLIENPSIRASCRELLLTLPTQDSLLEMLGSKKDYLSQEDRELQKNLETFKTTVLNPREPYRMLYGIEAMASIVSPTRLTGKSLILASRLSSAIADTDVHVALMDIFRQPHTVPTISSHDRHLIFERVLQILRIVFVQNGNAMRTLCDEREVQSDMGKYGSRMTGASGIRALLESTGDFSPINLPTLPGDEPRGELENNPNLCLQPDVMHFQMEDTKVVVKWNFDQCFGILSEIRDFIWICVAKSSDQSAALVPYVSEQEVLAGNNVTTASSMIRAENDRRTDVYCFPIVRELLTLMFQIAHKWIVENQAATKKNLPVHIFLHPAWGNFYEDLLVNTATADFRTSMHEALVIFAKDSIEVRHYILRMLLELVAKKLPFENNRTRDLGCLQRRQRQNSLEIVATITDCLVPREKSVEIKIEWSQVGPQPLSIVNAQMESFMEFPPFFGNTPESFIDEQYAAAKMKLISTLLFCCHLEANETCDRFLDFVFTKFLFPYTAVTRRNETVHESLRWEGHCREQAINALNILCGRNYKYMDRIMHFMENNQNLARKYDSNYRAITRSRLHDQVGMKNDGGTCYMNAIIQQLAHVPGLAAQWVSMQYIDPSLTWGEDTAALVVEMQKVLALLLFSKAQACVPQGLWKVFRFEPDVPLNTKQHHDAIDFYSVLLDRCDNVMQKLNRPPLFHNRFFGKYSYEKICYGCWHRYISPDEEFNCLSLALHGDSLEEALENFLDAHVMEGDNAYNCEKCSEKKTTLNRTSFRELPSTLSIQLKRFTYDVVNNQIKKDNQFFKFPMRVDMSPYMTESRIVPDEHVKDLFDDVLNFNNESVVCSPDPTSSPEHLPSPAANGNVAGQSPQKKLRRHRSSTMRLSQSLGSNDAPVPQSYLYDLVGVLAHSGIATAGHYYSFIKERREEMKDSPSYGKWYQINDTLVSPLLPDSIADLWFGGTFCNETGFNDLPDERIRHWNAYVLFYERVENVPPPIDNETEDSLNSLTEESLSSLTFDGNEIVIKTSNDSNEDGSCRKMRQIYESMTEGLRLFVESENFKFCKERDFFSTDYYNVFVGPCVELLKNDALAYTLDYSQKQFYQQAFTLGFEYIAYVAWQVFDDVRPPNFPRNSVELLKSLMARCHETREQFFITIAENEFELLNRLVEVTEPDVRSAFWQCLKFGLTKWMTHCQYASRSQLQDSSESSEDEDEEEDLDDETDSDEEFEDISYRPGARISRSISEHNINRSIVVNEAVRGIVRRLLHFFPVNRIEYIGKHTARLAVDCLFAIARGSAFGNRFLESARVVEIAGDVLLEALRSTQFSQPYPRFRAPEMRLKSLGLWPNLPSLFVELLSSGLDSARDPEISFFMNVPNSAIFMTSLFITAKMEADRYTDVEKTSEECRHIQRCVIDCFAQQISNLHVPGNERFCSGYIIDISQTVLKEMTNPPGLPMPYEEHWMYLVQLMICVGSKLISLGHLDLALQLIEGILDPGDIYLRNKGIHPGILFYVGKLLKGNDVSRAAKLFECVNQIRTCRIPEFAIMPLHYRPRHPKVFEMFLIGEEEAYDDALLEQAAISDDDKILDQMELATDSEQKSDNNAASTIELEDSPLATATVVKSSEIDLARDLLPKENDDLGIKRPTIVQHDSASKKPRNQL